MATNDKITTLLSIDAADAFTQMKEWKDYMDRLKAALMGLQKGTDDYNQVLEKLNDTQDKYSQVMDDVKGKNTAAEGSYNALNKQLIELRKSYKNLSEDARNSPVGTRMLEGISDLSDKLMDMDSQMKQWYRNVGNYQSAWQGLFEKSLGPLGKMGGTLGTISREVKGLIPLIGEVNSTALTGLKGITRAIAATGIGVLVIAVGELAAHWKDITGWIKEAVGWTDKATEAEERHKKELEAAANAAMTITEELEKQARLNAAAGMPEWMNLEGQNQALDDIIADYQKKINDLRDWNVTFANSALGEQQRQIERNKKTIEQYEGEISKLRKKQSENSAKITEIATKTLYDAEQALKTEEQIITETYNNNKKLLEQEGKDTTALTAKYNKDLDALHKKRQKLYSSTGKSAKDSMQQEKAAAEALVETIRKTTLNEYQLRKEEYDKSVALLEQYKKDGVITEEQLIQSKKILWDNWVKWTQDKEKEAVANAAKKILEETNKAIAEINEKGQSLGISKGLENELKKVEAELASWKQGFSFKGLWQQFYNPEGIKEARDAAIKDAEDAFNTFKADSDKRVATNKAAMAKLSEDSNEYKELQKANEEEQTAVKDAETKKRIAIAKAELEYEKAKVQELSGIFKTIAGGLDSIGAIMEAWANYRMQDLQRQVQENKKKESEAKKEFNRIKKLQIASLIVTNLAGQAGAFATNLAAYKWPYGAIIGGAQATAVLIQGMTQLAAIKRQQYGSSTAALNSTTPNMAEITNTYEPQYTTNVQTNTELSELANVMGNISPVVKVTDIDDAQNTVKVRNQENSF